MFALRVFPAVTRLTVYRWLHIPAQMVWAPGLAGKNLLFLNLNLDVLAMLLFVCHMLLYDQINSYEEYFVPRGIASAVLSVENYPGQSINFDQENENS